MVNNTGRRPPTLEDALKSFSDFEQYLDATEEGHRTADAITRAVLIMGLYKDWLDIAYPKDLAFLESESTDNQTFAEFLAELHAQVVKAMAIPPEMLQYAAGQ